MKTDFYTRKSIIDNLGRERALRARAKEEEQMVERPYQCTLCHAHFRNESGMLWHVSRRHEGPQALEALGKNYQGKLEGLENENTTKSKENGDLKSKLETTTLELAKAKMDTCKEMARNIKMMQRIQRLHGNISRMLLALVVRDELIKQRLGIVLPTPRIEEDDDSETNGTT